MNLVICTKFQVNRMNYVESRRGGGGPIDLPSRLRVTIFSRKLLGLNIDKADYISYVMKLFNKSEAKK